MQREASKSPARVLAPLALVVCAFAFFYVIFSSGSSDNGGATSTHHSSSQSTHGAAGPRPRKSSYTVKQGDSLDQIAAKTGVSAERLQELNPGLDPQGLVVGQKLKLRE